MTNGLIVFVDNPDMCMGAGDEVERMLILISAPCKA
jgi:hypothetical protein